MQKQLVYGEWKQAVISVRPLFELFKNFDEFKNLLMEDGYSAVGFEDLKNTIRSFFMLLSKFYHGLDQSNSSVNEDMQVYKEDAYLAYTFSISLLHLVSQKLKRNYQTRF